MRGAINCSASARLSKLPDRAVCNTEGVVQLITSSWINLISITVNAALFLLTMVVTRRSVSSDRRNDRHYLADQHARQTMLQRVADAFDGLDFLAGCVDSVEAGKVVPPNAAKVLGAKADIDWLARQYSELRVPLSAATESVTVVLTSGKVEMNGRVDRDAATRISQIVLCRFSLSSAHQLLADFRDQWADPRG